MKNFEKIEKNNLESIDDNIRYFYSLINFDTNPELIFLDPECFLYAYDNWLKMLKQMGLKNKFREEMEERYNALCYIEDFMETNKRYYDRSDSL